MQERLYQMLLDKDEITWQSIIHDLVQSEQMDPWDIDVSVLSQKYGERIRQLQDHSFFISGKVLLASAILLKLKCIKLVEEDLVSFDNQLFGRNEDLLDDFEEPNPIQHPDAPELLLKTPQLRKRKVSLDDLMEALNEALKVEERRSIRREKERVLRPPELPTKKVDITLLIKNLFDKIKNLFSSKKELTFTELVGSNEREDILMTFVPLLHLAHQRKVDTEQPVPFGEISIKLREETEEAEIH